MCKFHRCTTSPSFFNYFLLIYQICTFQRINYTNIKDELNCSYNGGGVVYVLKSELSRSTRQYSRSTHRCSLLITPQKLSGISEIGSLLNIAVKLYIYKDSAVRNTRKFKDFHHFFRHTRQPSNPI